MSRLCFPSRVASVCLGTTLLCGPTAGFDLLRPLDASFPPGIGISDATATEEGFPEVDDPSFEDQLIALVNQERWTNGQLAPLKRVDLLDTSSETHSTNMAVRNFVMHCDPDTGTMPWDRMVAAGYLYSNAGENIAWGYPDPTAVMAGWMAFANNTAWQLGYGNGSKTVSAEMRTGSTVVSASDTIILEDTGEVIFFDGFESASTSAWSAVSP
jgi:hypothetical protein